MELSENVRYMKLLHELKGAFPNMADENIQQCIKQHGMDKTACSGALRMLESQQLSTTHNQNYAPARMMPLNNVKDLHNFPRKMSLQGNNECEKILPTRRLRRPSSILPLTGINYPNSHQGGGGGSKKLPQKPSCDSVPKVVLTPESPHSKMHRTLYDPNGNEDSGLSMYGTTSTIEATLLDLDLESLSSMSTSSSSSDEPMCSVSRATFCRSNFRFLDNRGQDVASTAFTSVTRSSSSSSTPRPRLTTTMGLTDSSPSPVTTSIVTNPYRRIFEQRQQFYESISMHGNSSETSSLKSGWQRSQMRLHSQPTSTLQSNKDVFTVRTNIEPFGPFVIEHDVKSNVPPKLKNSATNKMMICLNPNNASDEFRYATSHSGEDGVESHLEVSLGKDGSIIKTRHSRADQEENSILKLQYGEGGKVLEIQQKQSLFVPQAPSRHNNKGASGPRPNSAYCTATFATPAASYFVPRYNSMPNLPDGRMNLRRQMTNDAGLLGFQTHPADEERIDIYTRALISHQLNQRCKLQQCLQHSKSQLQNLSRDVDDLKVLLEARTQFIQNGVVDVDVSKELERDIIPKLQTSCDDLVRQVTHLTQGSVPLGETSIDFYESLPAVLAPPITTSGEVAPGMSSPTTMSKSMPTTPRSSSTTTTTPAISSKSKNHHQHPMRSSSTVLTNSSQLQWPCTKCTFLNHPALKFCEECEMPRFNVNSASTAKSTTSAATKQIENDLG